MRAFDRACCPPAPCLQWSWHDRASLARIWLRHSADSPSENRCLAWTSVDDGVKLRASVDIRVELVGPLPEPQAGVSTAALRCAMKSLSSVGLRSETAQYAMPPCLK